MNTWIFQGNPQFFNVDSYLSNNKFIKWRVKRPNHQQLIGLGDEVFIWRSDGGSFGTGGIIARTLVVGELKTGNDEDAKEYWYTKDWKEAVPQVELEVLEVKLHSGFFLKKHSVLRDLHILKMPQGTNFLLSQQESNELAKLWGVERIIFDSPEEAIGYPEGREVYRMHRSYERNQLLIQQVKREAKATGQLKCKICEFSFLKTYGEEYIEAHHIVPVSQIREEYIATKSDIILVCANCHRMLHRKSEWLSGEQLQELVKANKQA